MKTKIKKIGLLLLVCFLFFGKTINAQITKLPECNNGVPHFNIDLSAKPDSLYITPEVTRVEQCGSVTIYLFFKNKSVNNG